MIGRIVACLSLCALAACVSGREERIVCDRVLTFGEEPSPSIPDRIRRVDFLPLEFSEAAAFRRADKLLFRNGLIYVGDFGSRKIVAYDMTGRVSFVIHRHGRGPGEYLEMKSFTADDRNVYVVDNASRRVLLYDCRTGVFRELKPLPVVAWDIEALHNGDFILAFSPLTGGTLSESQPNYRLFVTDSDFAVKRRLFAFDSGYSEPLGRPTYFSVSGDSLVFSSFWFDGFTVFDRRDAVGFRHVAIDFARGIPGKYRQDRDAVLDGPYRYPVAVPVLCGDYVAVDVRCGEYLDTYLFDPAADAFIGNSETGAYLFPPVAVFEGRFVALLPGSSYANLVEEGFPRAPDAVERNLNEDGNLLLFYGM